jgi:hypothetical protein
VIFVINNGLVHRIITPTRKQSWSQTNFVAIEKDGDHYSGLKCKSLISSNTTIIPSESQLSPTIENSLIVNLKMLRNSHAKNLIFAHNNINSIRNKFADVNELLENKLVDVLGIAETKLNDEFANALFENDQFKMYREDRSGTSGGLLLYVRADIPQTRVKNLEFTYDDETHIESLVVELTLKGQKWLLLLAYKNPKVPMKKFVTKLDHFYRENYDNYKEIILMNDSNIDLNKPNILTSEILNAYDLKNLIIGPTCFKTEVGTPIDQIIVKNYRHFNSQINLQCAFSDYHNLVGCISKLQMPPQEPTKLRYRSYKHFNDELFKKDVSNLPFHVADVFDDIDDKYWFQSNLLKNLIDYHAPIKTCTRKSQHIPYMTSELRKEMYIRNMYRNKYFKFRNSKEHENRFKEQRNKVSRMRKEAIKSYFRKHCNESVKPGDFWKCINPFLSKNIKSERNMILKETVTENDITTESIVTDKQDICNIFNAFFSNVANEIGKDDSIDFEEESITDILSKHVLHPSIKVIKENYPIINMFEFQKVSESYVKTLLKKVDPSKSTAFDDIPPKLIKMSYEELSPTITKLTNECIDSLTYPHDMKKAEVAPLFKTTKVNDMLKENFRPVSILPILGKILELVMADQLKLYFDNIFNIKLGAYRKRYGCDNILVKLVETWKKALDEKKFVGTVLMDLSKAFDCIPHSLLISKLYAYGVSESACIFLVSYLTNRHQRIKIQTKRSLWSLLTKGVPQGSILGPILFNIFINDIFLFIENCDLTNYADDNTLSSSSNTIDALVQILQTDVKSSINWFKNNYMQANADKFQVMFLKPLRSKQNLPKYFALDNIEIEVKNKVNLLGITIDDKLNFDEHISTICKKAGRQLNVLFRFHKILDYKQKLLLYRTFVISNFNFCPIVWHFSSITNMRQIDKIQERALRFLTGDHTSSYETLRKCIGIDCLYLKRIKDIAHEVYKTVNKINPEFMHDIFIKKDTTHDFRNGQKLIMPKFNTIQYGKMTFSYYGAHLWNMLPSHFKKSINFKIFKRLIKEWDGPNCSCTSCTILKTI